MPDPKFTVITPTRDRQLPFSLCCRWMERQTLKPQQWIVVDDGIEPVRFDDFLAGDIEVEHIRRKRMPTDPAHTLPLNLSMALDSVTTPYVIMMEDDDWYSEVYLACMMGLMPASPYGVVGQDHTIYYQLRGRRWRCASRASDCRASLCATGFRSGYISTVRRICEAIAARRSFLVDLAVWKYAPARCFTSTTLCVGMKQLPGMPGMSSGWTDAGNWSHDHGLDKLKALIGEADTELYMKAVTPNKEDTIAHRNTITSGSAGYAIDRPGIQAGGSR